MTIRPGDATDLEAITRLSYDCFGISTWNLRQFAGALADPNVRVFVALGASGLCGFLLAQEAAGEFEIHALAVRDSERRRGVARQLFAAAFPDPAPPVFLEVRASSLAAQAFYRALGFRECGRRREYYHDPLEDALVLRR